jgi:succinate dehydrogenase/fumarate reductase cytochrome b subunit
MSNYQGFFGIILLILDLWAIISVINSNNTTGNKVLWCLLVILLPLLGFIVWLIAGPRAAR